MTATAAPAHGVLAMMKPGIKYYEHQIDGVRQMARMGNVLLADDMGLGKSLQALTVCAVDHEMGRAKKMLVVAPPSLKGNWAEEITKFTNFDYHELHGTPAQRDKQLAMFKKADGDIDFLLVGYEQTVAHWEAFNDIGFDICLYDEAHAMKGHKSARTKACHKLHGRRHLLLTGSPLLNHVNDLWGLLYRIDSANYPSYWKFIHRYCLFGGFKNKEIVGIKNEAELLQALERVMIRRRKADVLDLPDKQYVQVWVDLLPKQVELYKQAKEELILDLPSQPEPDDLENPLKRFTRLKQICGTTAAIEGYDDFSAKLDVAVTKIADVIDTGKPVVVFTQFRPVLACLNQRLTAAGIDWRELHGDVPAPERVPTVRAWTEDAEAGRPQALTCMIQVAGVGLNMTAANTCIFVDKLFVPKLNEQGEDRIHRIGADTTQPVQIVELLARNTIEQRVETILSRKRKVFNLLVENDPMLQKKLYAALRAAMLEEEEDAA